MDSYKNVVGEKAYIGDISHGIGNLVLIKTYGSPDECCAKIKACKIPFRNICIELIAEVGGYNANMKRCITPIYGAKIEGIPVGDIFALPDWKE